MFGSHLSIAGGMQNALLEAQRLTMDCVQVFTKNQRQWKAAPLSAEQIELWKKHQADTGIRQTVSHDSYLINLGNPADAPWQQSIAVFRDELERCESLGIPWLVTHPGAHLGSGEPAGLKRIATALDQLHRDLPGYQVVTCLEITAGQGSSLGWKLEHLRDLIAQVRAPERLGVCLDSAHLLAAGYDLTSAAGAQAVLEEVDQVLGLHRIKVWHLNDSKTPRGSRVDRHNHIGLGHVSLDAFRTIVRHPAFAHVPKILETPKEKDDAGLDWDAKNLATLRGLLSAESKEKTAKSPKPKPSSRTKPK